MIEEGAFDLAWELFCYARGVTDERQAFRVALGAYLIAAEPVQLNTSIAENDSPS